MYATRKRTNERHFLMPFYDGNIIKQKTEKNIKCREATINILMYALLLKLKKKSFKKIKCSLNALKCIYSIDIG